jgi:subtilisin family serine protease
VTQLNEHSPLNIILTNGTNGSALRDTIAAYGGDTLRRITCANPCEDTLSITRLGDTITIDHYNILVLNINNDTSAARLVLALRELADVEFVDLNHIGYVTINPGDSYYVNGNQSGLETGFMNVKDVWTSEVGSSNVRVGIVDTGLDWKHCDLGAAIGFGQKVSGGWNYTENQFDMSLYSEHGTAVASVAGALTNNTNQCGQASLQGVAGVAGGWGTQNGATSRGIGVLLYGFRVAARNSTFTIQVASAFIQGAIFESSSRSTGGKYGYGLHIINNSYKFNNFDFGLHNATAFAYAHNVSFVAGKGNDGSGDYRFPADFNNNFVTSVGAHNANKAKWTHSNYDKWIDVVAPGTSDLLYTCKFESNGAIGHTGFMTADGTSLATPHVTGLIALLRSTAYRHGRHEFLFTEDYEGMVKASALDLDYSAPYRTDSRYETEQDVLTGCGMTQAGKLYEMLAEGYRVRHYTVSDLTAGPWQKRGQVSFQYAGGAKGVRYLAVTKKYSNVWVRQITGTYNLPTNIWDSNAQLYVWGTGGGNGALGGFSFDNPNEQVRWSEVTSGTGGKRNVGIKHSVTTPVTVRTFQHWIPVNNIGTNVPPDNDIRCFFSVFGKEINPSTFYPKDNSSSTLEDEKRLSTGASTLEVYPAPASDILTFVITLSEPAMIWGGVYDLHGREVANFPEVRLHNGTSTINIASSELHSGVYFVILSTGSKIMTKELVIIK